MHNSGRCATRAKCNARADVLDSKIVHLEGVNQMLQACSLLQPCSCALLSFKFICIFDHQLQLIDNSPFELWCLLQGRVTSDCAADLLGQSSLKDSDLLRGQYEGEAALHPGE